MGINNHICQWLVLSVLLLLFVPQPTYANNQYDGIIQSQSARTGIPFALIKAIIKAESSFRRKAKSPKGARGLMQLMPATARRFGVKHSYNAQQNIRGGATYLRWLWDRYQDWRLVLAAYNAGEGAVDKYGGIPPYRETQKYVRKVLGYYYQFNAPVLWSVMLEQAEPALPVVTKLNKQETDGAYQLFEAALGAKAIVHWQPPADYYLLQE